MITAVDTSVILDVLIDDPDFGCLAETALRKAGTEGKLTVCACVLAEIYPTLGDRRILEEFLADWQLQFSAMDVESAVLAGEYLSEYLSRGGKAHRVVPDFLIGAHAAATADRLLARNRGYLRDYFESLEVWDPTEPQPRGS